MFETDYKIKKKPPSTLVHECWYCGDFHITSEWRSKLGVEFESPCSVGHSPRTKVEGIDTICATPPVIPPEEHE